MKRRELKMGYEEIWGYIVSGLSLIWNIIPHTCEEWTTFFALLIMAVTFFFITLPRAIQNKKYLESLGKDENDKVV